MTDWSTVHDSRTERPDAIDMVSSESTVYERRNIRQETRAVQMGMETRETTEWVYEQREWDRAEYEATVSPATQAIIQAISSLELSVAELTMGTA